MLPLVRHAELVSASNVQPRLSVVVARWTLKRVQGDGVYWVSERLLMPRGGQFGQPFRARFVQWGEQDQALPRRTLDGIGAVPEADVAHAGHQRDIDMLGIGE